MTHTYSHRFASGTVATVILTLPEALEPTLYVIRRSRTPTASDDTEYGRWRQWILADMELVSGCEYRMVDDQPPFRWESLLA